MRVAIIAAWCVAAGWVLVFGTILVGSVAASFEALGLLDAQIYRMGGQAVLDGAALYDTVYPRDGLPFTYTPFAALVFVPLAAAGWSGGAAIMTIASIAASLRVCQIVVVQLRARFAPGTAVLAAVAVCVLVASWPVRSTLEYGQINLVIMWLVVEDLLGWGARRRWSGVLLGLAIGIKLTPVVFVVLLLWSRQLRRATVAVGAAVTTVAVGFAAMPDQAWSYWTDRLFETSRVGATEFIANQSLAGTIARTLGSPQTASWALAAGAVLVIATWLGGRLWVRGLPVEAVTAAAVGGLLVSPISWAHHWVWLVPVALVLTVPAGSERAGVRTARWILLAAVVVPGSVRIQTLLSAGADGWRDPAPLDRIVGSGYALVGLGYLAFLWVAHVRGGPAPSSTRRSTRSPAAVGRF